MRNPFKTPKPTLVRLHHVQMKESLEGLWDGRVVNGHYVLSAAKVVQDREGQSTTLAGDIFIPAAKVAFLQTIATDAR
jgi:hypothetical protein